MSLESPLRKRLARYVSDQSDAVRNRSEDAASAGIAFEVETIPYGDADDDGHLSCEIVATLGSVEAEYAAIRKGVGILDGPHRAVIRVTGSDRIEFLNRMITSELADVSGGDVRSSFWLNRKGRIEADLLVIAFEEETLFELDVHAIRPTIESLESYVFTEDVSFEPLTESHAVLLVHGRDAMGVLRDALDEGGPQEGGSDCGRATAQDAPIVWARRDQTGEPGYVLIVHRDQAEAVFDALVDSGEQLDGMRVRPIGWYAFNIARIEAGTPLFRVDFGPTNLPHETGVLRQRVSFTKGCYLGQEVVARIESLGKPRQRLVGLRIEGADLPVAGSQVFSVQDGEMDREVGVVTSSTLSPMRSAQPIAFGLIKTKFADEGTNVLVNAEGTQVEATIVPLTFWSRESAS